uniref:GPI ethanolamine phosphate transferase 3, catalytic subunit n=1 Tax=Timema shepardi TaxID=629360 RepID=A0A7R9B1Z9_TIMSH|nr:unnamed protein product [Timema shepardi]
MSIHWKYFLLFIWFSYLIVSGVLLFVRGFLLHREVQPQRATCKYRNNIFCENKYHGYLNKLGDEDIVINSSDLCSWDDDFLTRKSSEEYKHRPISLPTCTASNTKVVLLIIDALKFDFMDYNITLQENEAQAFQNKFTVVHELISSRPNNSKLFKFIADPPTTTMQRLKALTTGTLPTFVDVGSNFATPEINEDNLLDQLTTQNKTVVFMGDDTWVGLYPGRFIREYPFPSFNVWDLDTVDSGILDNLIVEIKKNDWSLLIAHFLGVDHCGHRYGPYHHEMSRKLKEMNSVISDVLEAIENNTMLFVIGDHGMTNTGDHGGSSEAEVTAAMFVHSPSSLINLQSMEGPKTIRQVDLVPSLATLLGVPIPFSNLGGVVLDVLPSSQDSLRDAQVALQATWNNIEQMSLYIRQYSTNTKQFSREKLDVLARAYESLKKKMFDLNREEDVKDVMREASEYLGLVREMCEEVWIQFDSVLMSHGLWVVFLSLFFMFVMVSGLPKDRLTEVLDGKFLVVGLTCVGVTVVGSALCYLAGSIESIDVAVYFSTSLVSMFLLASVVVKHWTVIMSRWLSKGRLSDRVGRLLLACSLCGSFSNSYVVEESRSLSYLLLTQLWWLVYNYRPTRHGGVNVKGKTPDKVVSSWVKMQVTPSRMFVGALVLTLSGVVRLSHYYWACREEQPSCETSTTHKQGRHGALNCLFTLVCLGLLVTAARIWLRSSGNLVGFSPVVMLARYVPTVVVVCTGGFWVLQALPKDTRAKLFLPWQLHILPWVVYCLVVLTFVCLFVRPLCVFYLLKEHDVMAPVYGQENIIPRLFNHMKEMMRARAQKEEDQGAPVVYGLATVYSAVFVVAGVFASLLVALLLGSVLAQALVLMVVACVLLLIMLSVIHAEGIIVAEQLFIVPWSSVLSWGLLASYFFYGTGHQPTFSNIQWEAAFVGTGGIFHTHVVPALLVGLNTFCAQLVMGLTLPLLLVAPFTLDSSTEGHLFQLDRSLVTVRQLHRSSTDHLLQLDSSTEGHLFQLNRSTEGHLFQLDRSLVTVRQINRRSFVPAQQINRRQQENNFHQQIRVMAPRLMSLGDPVTEDLKKGELFLYQRDDLLYHGLFDLCTKYTLFIGARMLACMLAGAMHCRHLMTWKVFAPKLMFEGLGLFVSLPSVLLGYLLVIRITQQVDKLLLHLDKEFS